MTLKKSLSFLLVLTMVLSVLAPCGALLQASAATTLYGDNLEQVTEPVIGESYYLGADVNGTMMYFRHGTVTDTVPYSLVTTDNINHNWCFKLTLEDSINTYEKFEGAFQFTYIHPTSGDVSRIYCYDVLKNEKVAGQTGVMDTGANTSSPYKNRHSFCVDTIEGKTILKQYGNGNVLVIKQVPQTVNGEEVLAWRMLGVPATELSNDGVYPVMLLQEHTHTLGDAVADAAANTVSRSCDCGYVETVYDCKVSSVDKAVAGESYYLTANVNGTIRYFIHGTVTETAPASLRTSDDLEHNWAFPVLLEAPVEGDVGFQMTYTNPSNGNTARIYCYDSVGSDDVADTGVNSTSTLEKHTFFEDTVGGVKVLRKIGNNCVLVVKELEYSRNVTDADGNTTTQTGTEWRILGVDESELANEGVYPVLLTQKHEHVAASTSYAISDSGHSPLCWCGAPAAEVAHTYGEVTADDASNTHSRSCTVCGYENVIYGEKYEQVKTPTVGETYYLAANVDGQLLSCNVAGGGYTATSPYSLKTTSTIYSFTLNKALKAGQGEFQLVDENGKYLYSVAAGAGATVSSGYITYPEKVSFLMDEVNGQTVIRAYGTQNILVAKYSDAQSAWRIWCLPETELANEGVYPVVLLGEHEHTYGAWSFDTENHTQNRTCELCGIVDTLYGADDKVSMVTEPVIGESYYLVANVDGKIYYFRHGTATDTAPYSLVVTSNFAHNWVLPVTIEDPTTTNEKITTGFQMTYTNPSTEALARIYCYDVLKDEKVAGQTGVMDTGINSANYQNRHNFTVQQIDGQTVLHKTGNNNVLVVKYNSDKGDYRMLGVPQSELGTEGVYPVMLANVHTHVFGEELHSNGVGHWHACQCGSKDAVESHDFDSWTLDAEAQTQSAVCTDCGYELQAQSPYFDVIESKNELDLGEIVYDEEAAAYSVTGGEEYYLMTEVDGQYYYFRQTNRTALGNSESVTSTAAYSLCSTNDPNHRAIGKVKIVAGNTENTYILTTTTDATRVIYVNNEGKDTDIDVGITAFKGASDDATYIARAEALWDEENGYFYHVEDDTKYVLVLKQLEATYKGTNADGESVVVETATEWRIAAVPEKEAIPENGCYIVKLTAHIHNFDAEYSTDNEYHWKNCGCGYQDKAAHTVESWTVVTAPTETETGSKTGVCTVCGATVTVETPITVNEWNITLSDNIGVNFVLALTEGDEVTVTVDDSEVPVTLLDNGNGTFNVAIELAAAQMTSEISITVNGYAVEKTYSVRAYADAILAGDYTDAAKALVQYMLVYGSAAQNYFDCNKGNLAGEDINVTLVEPETAAELEVYNEFEAVKFYGASLVHKTKTAVRFYFTAESIEGLTFLVDGNVYEPVSKDGKYYIEVAGINPQDLADTISVVVTDGTSSLSVKYSPLIYIERMYHKSGVAQTTKDLVQTMYNYHLSAKDYIIKTYTGGIKESTSKELYAGVELREMSYIAANYGDIAAYALIVDADANVELKISAGAWNEANNADNPAEAKTVANHFRAVKNAGNNVLAMTNGGFFDYNKGNGSNVPYGMQIVDGVVKQEPSTVIPKYSDNWFGMTMDGKYVISNTEGYESTYKGNIQQGVGGGRLLMIDGVAQEIESTRDYRTAVGVNADGDMVLVAVEAATYSDVTGIFAGLGLEIVTVLNLDGGGSTAMYVPGTYYPKSLILGDDGFFAREVADAIAIVEKQ